MASNPCNSLFKDQHIIEIENFYKELDDAQNGRNPIVKHFYTSRLQKIAMVLYLKGDCKDSDGFASLFFCSNHGSFEDLTKWPMDANFHFCVLYRNVEYGKRRYLTKNATNSAFQRPKTNKKFSDVWGFTRFMQLDDVLNLVANDCLSIKIEIEHL